MNRKKGISFGKISFTKPAEKPPEFENDQGFKKFGKESYTAMEEVPDDLEGQEMKNLMGITGFGKKAKSFDIQEMLEQVKKTARQVTQSSKKEAEPSTASSTVTSETVETNDDESSDEELIGPPIPEIVKKPKEGSDDDSDDEEEEDDGDLINKIPSSHEVSMNHGMKAITAIAADPSGARLGKSNTITLRSFKI